MCGTISLPAPIMLSLIITVAVGGFFLVQIMANKRPDLVYRIQQWLFNGGGMKVVMLFILTSSLVITALAVLFCI